MKDEKLSKNFRLREFIVSAERPDIASKIEPPIEIIENLRALAKAVLQPIRYMLGEEVKINSGYRSPELNSAIGGSNNSEHLRGLAADITSKMIRKDMAIIARSIWVMRLPIHQLIYYPGRGFLHVSLLTGGTSRSSMLRSPSKGKYITEFSRENKNV